MDEDQFEQALQALVDRQEIAANIACHSRGIDRRDEPLLKSVYHPDAQVAYGFFDGAAHEMADLLTGGVGGSLTMHRPSNVWIRVDGDRSVSESYVTVYTHSAGEDGGNGTQTLIGGRYLDVHERRNGCWKLSHRTYVLDWNLNRPGTGSADPNFVAAFGRPGGHGADDYGNQLLAEWAKSMAEEPKKGEATVEISADLAAKAEIAFARGDIHDLIMAQARATDRHDEALFRSVFHPDATVDVAAYDGPADGYVSMILDGTAELKRMAHSVANEWINVSGDKATAESYVIAFTTTPGDDHDTDDLTGGRYLDRFERRDGVWKFTHRTFVSDWLVSQPSTDQSEEGMFADLRTRGGIYPDDPVYKFWNS